jgi:hypothetical protein
MSSHRWEAQAWLEDGMTEGRIDSSALALVTVCLCDGSGEVSDELGLPVAPAPPVVLYLRPSEARALAFCLLELAEHAERRSDSSR